MTGGVSNLWCLARLQHSELPCVRHDHVELSLQARISELAIDAVSVNETREVTTQSHSIQCIIKDKHLMHLVPDERNS